MLAFGSLADNNGDERRLSFYHTHTGDSLQVVYFRRGEYDAGALADIRVFLAELAPRVLSGQRRAQLVVRIYLA